MEMSKALLIFVPLGLIFSALNLAILFLAYWKPGNSTTDPENNNSESDRFLPLVDRRACFKVGMSIFSEGLALFAARNFTSRETLAVLAFVLYAIGIAAMHFSLVWNNLLGRVWKLFIAAASLATLAAGIVFILTFLQSN